MTGEHLFKAGLNTALKLATTPGLFRPATSAIPSSLTADPPDCPVCTLHRATMVAEGYINDACEECVTLEPGAALPKPYGGLMPLVSKSLDQAREAALRVAGSQSPGAPIAAKLPEIIDNLQARLKDVKCGDATAIRTNLTAMRKVTKKVAELEFTPRTAAGCTTCKARGA